MAGRHGWTAVVPIALFLLTGCLGTSVMVGNEPPPPAGPPAGYSKGPPPWAPAHGYRAKHHYRYYPSSCVYFDNGRGLFFYLSNGGWQVGVSLPSYIRISVNEFITLDMDTDRPYLYHPEVVKRYPPGQMKKRHKKGRDKWD